MYLGFSYRDKGGRVVAENKTKKLMKNM